MRKVSKMMVVVVFVLVAFGLSGCRKGEEMPEELKESAKKTESDLIKEYTRNTDKEFWNSAVNAATLVSETVEGNREYDVVFEIETSGGDLFAIQQQQVAGDIDSLWRDLCLNQILLKLVSNEKVENARLQGEEVRVASVTLLSPEYNEDGSGMEVIELADYENDGKWDYKTISK